MHQVKYLIVAPTFVICIKKLSGFSHFKQKRYAVVWNAGSLIPVSQIPKSVFIKFLAWVRFVLSVY